MMDIEQREIEQDRVSAFLLQNENLGCFGDVSLYKSLSPSKRTKESRDTGSKG